MPPCERCRKKDASVFITQVIFGNTTKVSLCESCVGTVGALGLPTVTLDQVSRAMGMDPAEVMAKAQAETLNLPADAPTEVFLPDSMTVPELADALHAKVYQVIFVLMQHGKFAKPDDVVDFAAAALVCEQFAVTPRRA